MHRRGFSYPPPYTRSGPYLYTVDPSKESENAGRVGDMRESGGHHRRPSLISLHPLLPPSLPFSLALVQISRDLSPAALFRSLSLSLDGLMK
jgi:hypothetical protein